LEDGVLATLLLGEDLKSLLLVAGGNDAVRDLAGDDLGGGDIDLVRERNPVAKGRHAVSTTCTGVCGRNRAQLLVLEIIDHVDLLLGGRKRHGDRGTGRAHVLERRVRCEACGRVELLHQLPRVKCVQQVDVARRAVQNCRVS